MAINYFKTVLGVAVQIMAMVLIVGIGNDMLTSFYAKMNKGTLNFEELGVMLVFCLALLMLINRVPPLIAGVISGSGIGNAGGIGNFGAGAAVGAAMGASGVAAGAAGMAGAALMSGAANISGGASAIKAAFEKAQSSASSDAGAGMDMDMMASMGSVGTSSGQGSAGTGESPFAQAAGFGGGSSMGGNSGGAAKDASAASEQPANTDTGSNGADKAAKNEPKAAGGRPSVTGELAKGAGAVLKGKVAQVAEGFQARIDQTVGGQVATAIRASAAEQSPAFEVNSLAGAQVAEPDDEVAAFVNRSTPA